MQRLKTRPQFQACLAGGVVSRSPHFALHRAALPEAALPSTTESLPATADTSRKAAPLFPSTDVWLGAMVPKRWARRAVTRNAIKRHVEKFVAMVGLSAAIDKKPSQLSGGMKQRVGIARAFAIQPKMLLLDEPFGALDALTRGTIQDELMAIVRETQQTVFMITHDVDEAILLADRILLMSNGSETGAGYVPGGIAEVVTNPLPRQRTRASLHHLDGYYDFRNHIVDFLVTRATAH